MTNIDLAVSQAIQNKIFPGAVIGTIANDQQTIRAYGNLTYDKDATPTTNDTLYDLASITKVIPTASLALKLIQDGTFSLDTKVVDYVPEIRAKDRNKITIRHLLTYTIIFDIPSFRQMATTGGKELLEASLTTELKAIPGTKLLYTNIASTILTLVVERAAKKPFAMLAQETFFGPLGMKRTTFRPQKERAAPTEVNWRGTVQGQVHDESAMALAKSGVSIGHAGLFSTVGDLLLFAQMLLNGGKLNGKHYFKPQTIEQMHTNQLGNINQVWGLGWSIPGGQFDFFGSHVSPQAFGMTGFTGTSILIDPIKKRALVVLTNATFPKRKNDKEVMNTIRRQLADIVFG